MGITIGGTPVKLLGIAKFFPIRFLGHKSSICLSRIYTIEDDYILGSEFLSRVSPFIIENENMVFKFSLDGQRISFLLFHEGIYWCNRVCRQLVDISLGNTSELYKLERPVLFA